jgi:hypothetical protein
MLVANLKLRLVKEPRGSISTTCDSISCNNGARASVVSATLKEDPDKVSIPGFVLYLTNENLEPPE